MEANVADQHDDSQIDEQAAQASSEASEAASGDDGAVNAAAEEGAITDPDVLQAELAKIAEELAEARDQALRVAAEAQNIRRRADKDVESARKFALERFASELLPV